MSDERMTADEFRALTGEELWGVMDWREDRATRDRPLSGDARISEIDNDQPMGDIIRPFALVVFVLVLGGSPKPPPPGPEDTIQAFRPGEAKHSGEIEALTRRAAQVLARNEMTPESSPGLVTTQWGPWDSRKWPGVFVRFVITITEDTIVVDIQCKTRRGSCSGALPDGERASGVAQELANTIAESAPPKPKAAVEDVDSPPPPRVCFTIENAEPACFATVEECERQRAEHGDGAGEACVAR